jgi:hypothetical protein
VARRLPSLGEMVGIGVAVGLALSVRLGADYALPLAAAGALVGTVWSYKKVPDAPVCRVPRLLRGCGGSTVVKDRKGNTGAPRRCWAHPGGKPKRLVNIAILASIYATLGLVLVIAVAVRRGG